MCGNGSFLLILCKWPRGVLRLAFGRPDTAPFGESASGGVEGRGYLFAYRCRMSLRGAAWRMTIAFLVFVCVSPGIIKVPQMMSVPYLAGAA